MGDEDLLSKLTQAIVDCDEKMATQVSQEILTSGIDPLHAIHQGAVKGLDIVGEKFQRLEAFLPELVLSGEVMKACLAVLVPHIKPEQMDEVLLGRVVIGTVSGDIHDIGKNMVAAMLSITGFEIYDLGVDIPAKRFVEKAIEVNAKVIALSALLKTTAYYQEDVINYLRDSGLRQDYYVVVGGAPVNAQWAAQIGADGYGKNAIEASQVMKKLLAEGVNPPLPKPIVIEKKP